MKTKFVNVWDDSRWGYVGYILLQVEESDVFLTEKNFEPGYKFIIQAIYNQVGAAGGYKFIPSYGESVQEKTKKIKSNEADVLGLYISNVDDIFDIPDDLYTEKFWGIVNTKTKYNEKLEAELTSDDYYKVAYQIKIFSWNKQIEIIKSGIEKYPEIFGENQTDELERKLEKQDQFMKRISKDLDKERIQVYYAYVNKETLKIEKECYVIGSNEMVINNYLWEPNDELPIELWEEVKKNNSKYGLEDEESVTLPERAELYYCNKCSM